MKCTSLLLCRISHQTHSVSKLIHSALSKLCLKKTQEVLPIIRQSQKWLFWAKIAWSFGYISRNALRYWRNNVCRKNTILKIVTRNSNKKFHRFWHITLILLILSRSLKADLDNHNSTRRSKLVLSQGLFTFIYKFRGLAKFEQ